MRARTFFYVCGGIFLLAVTYHLAARSATAQAPGVVTAAGAAIGFNAAVGRTIHTLSFGGGGGATARPPVPGTSAIIAVEGNLSGNSVVLENGDAYTINPGGAWTYHGNVFGGGPTPAQQESWGALKSRYRGERGAAQPTPQDR